MANASNFTRGFTPASNPETGNNIWATKWAFIYVKRAKAKKQCHIVHYSSHSTEWPMQAISREALPLPATPKGVTTYGQRNGLLFMLKGPMLKKTVSYRTLGLPENGMANASNFTRGFTPASNPEMGNNLMGNEMGFSLC